MAVVREYERLYATGDVPGFRVVVLLPLTLSILHVPGTPFLHATE